MNTGGRYFGIIMFLALLMGACAPLGFVALILVLLYSAITGY